MKAQMLIWSKVFDSCRGVCPLGFDPGAPIGRRALL